MIVHDVGEAPNNPSLNERLVAVEVTVPPHWEAAGGSENVSPAGRVSVNATPVNGVEVELVNVMVNVLVPPTLNVEGENTFVVLIDW